MSENFDAVVVGSGPNGLAAAVTLARDGRSVVLYEAEQRLGGGLHTEEVTLPGFRHDICSAIHPLGIGSPFFRSLNLEQFGLEWIFSPVEVAHPLRDDHAAWLSRDIVGTAAQFGADGVRYQSLLRPFIDRMADLKAEVLGPAHLPKNPFLLARFGWYAMRSARQLGQIYFHDERLGAAISGLAAHSVLPMDRAGTAAFAMLFALFAHTDGWPFPRGGAASLADALAASFRSYGGVIRSGQRIDSLDALPAHHVLLCDLTPKEFVRIAGHKLSSVYRWQLERYRYGSGVFKIDYALSSPTPFLSEHCRRAATVHIGGTFDEVADSERLVGEGHHPAKPFVLFVQQSQFDSTRAPAGKHTAWAYCHVPNGSTEDMTVPIENQIERFAPGFRDVILARSTMRCAQFEQLNPNYVGGDINGGALDLPQILFRPSIGFRPYNTSLSNTYLCSAATPPGSGIHGMCGYHAASLALREHFT